MRHRSVYVFVLIPILLLTTDCAGLVDRMIPAHGNSKATKSPELTCLYLLKTQRGTAPEIKVVPAIAAMLLPIVVGFAVDQFGKALSEEAKRYQASYSGRGTEYLLEARYDEKGALDSVTLRFDRILLARYFGADAEAIGHCPPAGQARKEQDLEPQLKSAALVFRADIKTEREIGGGDNPARFGPGGQANPKVPIGIVIIPAQVELRQAKAKVPFFRNEIDMKSDISISTFVLDDKDKTVKEVDVLKEAIPLKKFELPADGQVTDRKVFDRSNFRPLPVFHIPETLTGGKGQSVSVGLVNVNITISESDDFGDVIGDAAKGVPDLKKALTDAVKDALKSK